MVLAEWLKRLLYHTEDNKQLLSTAVSYCQQTTTVNYCQLSATMHWILLFCIAIALYSGELLVKLSSFNLGLYLRPMLTETEKYFSVREDLDFQTQQ